jgi:hypothetical protein
LEVEELQTYQEKVDILVTVTDIAKSFWFDQRNQRKLFDEIGESFNSFEEWYNLDVEKASPILATVVADFYSNSLAKGTEYIVYSQF